MKFDGMTAEFPRNSLKVPEKRLAKVLKDVRLRRHFLPLIRAMSGSSEQLRSADRIESAGWLLVARFCKMGALMPLDNRVTKVRKEAILKHSG